VNQKQNSRAVVVAANGSRCNRAKVITACGVQGDYIIQQVRQNIVNKFPDINNISAPMRMAEPSGSQPGQSHSDVHMHTVHMSAMWALVYLPQMVHGAMAH
jgi:hypothetical protein